METHLPNKSSKKTRDFAMARHNWTNQQTDLLHSVWNADLVILKCLSKVVRYNNLPELSYTTAFPKSRYPPEKAR